MPNDFYFHHKSQIDFVMWFNKNFLAFLKPEKNLNKHSADIQEKSKN